MKTFARWLYTLTHQAELLAVARMARASTPTPEAAAVNLSSAYAAGKCLGHKLGALDALDALDLLA